jgi:hypothetical protein
MIYGRLVAAGRFNLNQRAETVDQIHLVPANLLDNARNIDAYRR